MEPWATLEMGSSCSVKQTTVLHSKGHLPRHCTHLLGEGLEWMPEDLAGCRLRLTISLSFSSLSLPHPFYLLSPPCSQGCPKPQPEQTKEGPSPDVGEN